MLTGAKREGRLFEDEQLPLLIITVGNMLSIKNIYEYNGHAGCVNNQTQTAGKFIIKMK